MTLTSEVPVLLQNCNCGMCKEKEVRTRCASAVAAWSAWRGQGAGGKSVTLRHTVLHQINANKLLM
jgi:hypothetical protein